MALQLKQWHCSNGVHAQREERVVDYPALCMYCSSPCCSQKYCSCIHRSTRSHSIIPEYGRFRSLPVVTCSSSYHCTRSPSGLHAKNFTKYLDKNTRLQSFQWLTKFKILQLHCYCFFLYTLLQSMLSPSAHHSRFCMGRR